MLVDSPPTCVVYCVLYGVRVQVFVSGLGGVNVTDTPSFPLVLASLPEPIARWVPCHKEGRLGGVVVAVVGVLGGGGGGSPPAYSSVR
jgi:hypothetical protein